MAAINLDSLSTFWQSVKSYFTSRCEDVTELWSGSSQTVQLTESMDNFERIEITWEDNAQQKYVQEVVPVLTASYATLYSFFGYNGGTTYLKLINITLDSNRLGFSVSREVEVSIGFGTGASVSRSVKSNFSSILKVRGIHRIASN